MSRQACGNGRESWCVVTPEIHWEIYWLESKRTAFFKEDFKPDINERLLLFNWSKIFWSNLSAFMESHTDFSARQDANPFNYMRETRDEMSLKPSVFCGSWKPTTQIKACWVFFILKLGSVGAILQIFKYFHHSVLNSVWLGVCRTVKISLTWEYFPWLFH